MATDARRALLVAIAGLAAVIAAAAALPLIGSAKIELARAWSGASPDAEILFAVRLPRVILSLLAGGGLAVAGVIFQALLRDALAAPYTLGVSSGASLGAVIAIVTGSPWIWPFGVAGAGITLLAVLAAGARGRKLSSFTLLMAGVTVNSICLAMILFLHSIAGLTQSFAISRWLMGGIEPPPTQSLVWLGVVVVALALAALAEARRWNLMAVGEEWAAIRGTPAHGLMLRGYIGASVLAGLISAFTGPIGFVGLIVPHALRLAFGPDHRVLLPGSFLFGAAFLGVCDTVARTAIAPAEIPVGVITALLGGPFFIWLLRTR